MDIAIVGAGIAGLSCAWRLGGGRLGAEAPAATAPTRVTLYEADATLGGHTRTVDVEVGGIRHPIDTGFLVFNHRTYPRLTALLDALDVDTAPSEMSLSVQSMDGPRTVEWAGTDLDAVFAQRRNLASPRFWRMLADIVRFNRRATALASGDACGALATWSLGEYLDAERYSSAFRDWYLLPMAAAIWSCPAARMRDFPLATFVGFCANHGLLQLAGRPQWYTIPGGARRYVERIAAALDDVRTATPVRSVARTRIDGQDKIAVDGRDGVALYDHVVLACHSDQAIRLVADADAAEREVLGAIGYRANRAVVHTDASVLPRRERAWAAWNVRRVVASRDGAADASAVCVDYLINRLQPVPFDRPVIVSLNPLRPPAPATVLDTVAFEHPVFDARAIVAQRRLADVQGRGNLWFAGAWTGYGFHEDGLASGLGVADAIAARGVAGGEVRLAA